MGKILRQESSLLRRENAIARELAHRRLTRRLVWSAALLLAAWGALRTAQTRQPWGAITGTLVLVLAGGYELRLREIAEEQRQIAGGRHGERALAERLAEQLADDHLILNDLDFRIAHERCQIDHLVLAPAGLYLIESKFWAGTLQGQVRDARWLQIRPDGSRRRVRNPVEQVERQRRLFAAWLAARVPEDRIHALVVFSHPSVQLHIQGAENRVFRIADAVRFINQRCFDPPALSAAELADLAEKITRAQR